MENNRYEIQRKINEDKFSTTFKAYDKKLNRYLSFKEYNDNKYFDTLTNSLKSLSNLHHPNILEMYDLMISSDDKCFLTYEFFDGISLDNLFKRKDVSESFLLDILRKVLLSLIYSENNGIFFGNLRIYNMVVDENNNFKIDIFKNFDGENFGNSEAQLNHNINLLLEILENSNIDIENSIFNSFYQNLRNNSYDDTQGIMKDLNKIDNYKMTGSNNESIDNTIKLDLKNEHEKNMSYKIDENFFEEEIKNKKKSHNYLKSFLVYFTSVLLAFIAAAAIIFYYNLRPKAPDYVGKNLRLAVDQATANDIELVVDKSVSVDKSDFNKYVVIGQSPKVGDKLLFKKKIKVELGLEKEDTMINLIGLNLKKAKKELSNLGLNVKKVRYKKSSVYDEGVVIDQSIEAGRNIKNGDFITITVSSGKARKTETVEDEYTPPEENERPNEDETDNSSVDNNDSNSDNNQESDNENTRKNDNNSGE
ncbi:MAG: PASTA domain-containing protein [Finegoldia magna]|uniref:PASTA domain-containing protein n=1 Tax=Finegoldia magna TaxID=1260 RepID=UPI000B91C553|nr:PASTA domain-containing protein [Finegoldia magna]MDU1010001.1 PASTA domain-containing protein [Finegoldia magna]MDU1087024.1 PASTA domain-containing protein [Finegoldia magna]MDU7889667.1 PASTA domain-containing protein [Finegoldia magna]OXZ38643.1 serine/threonine protein kinase [Finegoldia magna]